MTILQVKDKLQALKPHAYEASEVVAWLSTVEGRVYAELIQTHANDDLIVFAGYTAETPDSTLLIAPEPYDELYLYYLMMQVDLHNMELDKYNNSLTLYKEAWNAFARFWNRTYLPVQTITHFAL